MQTRDIVAGDGVLRTRIMGQGPAIVFVHGALVDSRLWDTVATALARRYTVVLPDLPLGSHTVALPERADRSVAGQAKRVAALLEALDLRDVTLVGNDSGGVISQLVAADHGERVGRLVLTNCDALEVFPPRAFAYFNLIGRYPSLLVALAWLLNTVPLLARAPNAYGWLTKERIDATLLCSWLLPSRDAAIQRDFAGLCSSVSIEVTLQVAERLRAFPGPVLLAWGTRDPFFPISLASRLAAMLPQATIERFDAATFVPLDEPLLLASAIERFAAPAMRTSA